jgi:uncharacterized protein
VYQSGEGVPQDYTAAAAWYRKAAEQGHAEAQYSLGSIYQNGYGVPEDFSAAASWYRRAAEQGDPDGQYMLGGAYQSGIGVLQDYVQAHKWLLLAVSRFAATDNEKLGEALKKRDALAGKMTPAQIAEAEKLAREWKLKPER